MQPVHHILLILIIGQINNDEKMIAGVGLGNSFSSIVLTSTGTKFIKEGACTLISQSFGQKDYRMC